MSNKNYRNDHFRIDLRSIIKRLPLQGHINQSQNSLIVFSPAWIEWVKGEFPGEFKKFVTLNSFNQGVLSIRCTSSVAASQLKHMQVSLLESLHSAGHVQIKRVKIEIDHYSHTASDENVSSSLSDYIEIKTTTRSPLGDNVMSNLEHCQKGIKNEKLSKSLKKLNETLKDLKK